MTNSRASRAPARSYRRQPLPNAGGETAALDLVADQLCTSVLPFMPAADWLEAIGFVVVDAEGNWRPTELCEAELARLRGQLH